MKTAKWADRGYDCSELSVIEGTERNWNQDFCHNVLKMDSSKAVPHNQ